MKDLLDRLRACESAKAWVGDRSLPTAWNECARADWMLWLAARLEVDTRLLVRAACACIREVPKDSLNADVIKLTSRVLEEAEAWSNGQRNLVDLQLVSDDLYWKVDLSYMLEAMHSLLKVVKLAASNLPSRIPYFVSFAISFAVGSTCTPIQSQSQQATATNELQVKLTQIVREKVPLDLLMEKLK